MTTNDTSSSDGGELTRDEVYELFNNARRRYVLYLLDKAPDGMSISDLTDQVAAWEQGSTVDEITQQERKRVYVSLYQTHVVNMDELGVVNFDRDSGIVTLTQKADQVREFLPESSEQHSWPLYYLGVVLTGLVIYTLKFVGLLDIVPWAVIAGVVYAGFVLLTVWYYYSIQTAEGGFEDLVREP